MVSRRVQPRLAAEVDRAARLAGPPSQPRHEGRNELLVKIERCVRMSGGAPGQARVASSYRRRYVARTSSR
jgi:hypothetical protein